ACPIALACTWRKIECTCVGSDQLGIRLTLSRNSIGIAEAPGLNFLRGKVHGRWGRAAELPGMNHLRWTRSPRNFQHGGREIVGDNHFRRRRHIRPRHLNVMRHNHFRKRDGCRRKQLGMYSWSFWLVGRGPQRWNWDEFGYVIPLIQLQSLRNQQAE